MTITRARLHEIIFEADTPEGKLFDIALMISILFSVIVVMLDSVASFRNQYHIYFLFLEYIFTALFTLEYILRIISIKKPWKYITSFFGLIDLLSILPTYLMFLLPGAQSLLIIRMFRLLRVFRVLKLSRYTFASMYLIQSLKASKHKIFVFLSTVLTIVVIIGAIMYFLEGERAGFVNIPVSIYWAIVTITTVGYGDIAPITPYGQFLASCLMIIGYAIIAVPTGIITVEMAKRQNTLHNNTITCAVCAREGHDSDAAYCKFCGAKL